MKYLCLVYHDEAAVAALSARESNAILDDVLAFREELRSSGHYVASALLQPDHAAITVRERRGTLSIADGPVAETREQLGGFYLIEARDLDEAIRVASTMPPARQGSVEVRPLKESDYP